MKNGNFKVFQDLAEHIPQIVWIANEIGQIEYYNKRWYDYINIKKHNAENIKWEDFFHPNDLYKTLNAWEKAFKENVPFEMEYRLKNGKTGDYRWFLGRAVSSYDKEKKVLKWIGTSTDIHEQKKAIEYQTFLSEASKILSSSINYKKTFRNLAKVSVPHICDWFVIDLIRENTVETVTIAHKDFMKIKLAKEYRKSNPVILNKDSVIAKIIKSGQSKLFSNVTSKMLEKLVKDKKRLMIIKKLGIHSGMIVPLTINNKVIGAITFIYAESKRIYNRQDLRMAEDLASRISLALYNSQLYAESKKNQAQFLALYKANIIGVVYSDFKGNVIKTNNAFLKMLGYNKEDVLSGKLNLKNITPPEYREIDRKKAKEILKDYSTTPWEKEYIKKDGSQVPVILGAALINEQALETVAFVLDISERKKLEQRKDEFIGIASHELKTPLTSIKGYVQILERIIQQMGDDKLKLYLRKTNNYIDRLDSLIIELLDVSKIQSGKLRLNFEKFKIKNIVNNSIESIQHLNSRHKLIKEGNFDTYIFGDKNRLEQVLTNLISNAVKYSPDANKVIIRVKQLDKNIQFEVEDFGIGISKKEQQLLFQRFYRVETIAKKFSGLGIGLYISSEIVSRHGGKIWVESQLKKGSKFCFTIPDKSLKKQNKITLKPASLSSKKI